MNNRNLAVVASLMFLVAGAACSPQNDATGRDLTGPARGLEGLRVTGTLRTTTYVSGGPAGAAGAAAPGETRSDTTEPFDARIRRGAARDPAIGLVATSHGLAGGRRQAQYRDRHGHRYDLLATSDAPGSPVSRLALAVDGRKLADVTLSWREVAGTWVLVEREEVFYHDGIELLRRHRTSDAVQVARAGLPARSGAMLARALLPAPAHAEMVYCEQEWVVYGAASLGVVLTAERAYTQWWNLTAWRNYLVAAGAWGLALDALLACITLNG